MSIIKKISNQLNYALSIFYYIKSAAIRNSYPCKLVAEKINPIDKSKVVISLAGEKKLLTLPIDVILHDKNIISALHPKDAMLIGRLAFNNMAENSQPNNYEKFLKIKDKMLSSTNDTWDNKNINPFIKIDEIEISTSSKLTKNNEDTINELIRSNRYTFKLVDYKSTNSPQKTIIVYTIFGKKEGFQKSLEEILCSDVLIAKFHPTTAVKFGFILAGDIFFDAQKHEGNIC